ncbi:hypothetical protein BXZ70DRAFT_996354 [Cristinia sonorae]|uniref:Uncharacterized protein n=1 Tax=Cristinia sonorae TaxID=1940300 RepID=A0A8K0UE38_9AGAR|nr:hypothetical protein BXZ70DRAFT_996354 [Cristinia sonorae]
MSGTNEAGTHLTTSRIARVFRPLRAKCLALSAPLPTSTTRHHAPVKYGRASRNISNYIPSVIERAFSFTPIPPAQSLALQHSSTSIEHVRGLTALSNKINEVRDAFRNVVKVAYGGWPAHAAATSTSRIPRLGAMCAVTIGNYLDADDEDSDEDNADSTFDNDDVDAMYGLYESIPPHYRRYAMASHALKHILDTCPHYPTLLSGLLEVALAFKLLAETEQLLRALLLAAFHPRCSLDEVQFVSIYHKCCKPSFGSDPVITNAVFARILISTIEETTTESATPWSLTAVKMVVKSIRSQDLYSYITICLSIAHAFSTRPGEDQLSSVAPVVQSVLSRFVVMSEHDSATYYHPLADFLCGLHELGYTKYACGELQHNISALTLFCVALPLSKTHGDQQDVLLRILRSISPTTDTYQDFMHLIFPGEIIDSPESSPAFDVDIWTDALRRNNMCRHEAAFCSSALSRVETLLGMQPSYRTSATNRMFRDLEVLRVTLVDRVEEAERLYFGEEGVGSPAVDRTQWRWEEMLDCWVRKSPLVSKQPRKAKKTKLRHAFSHTEIARPTFLTTVPRADRAPSLSSSSTAHSSQSPELNSGAEDTVTPPSSPPPYAESPCSPTPDPPARSQPMPPPPVFNFGTLLSDLQNHVVVLHTPKKQPLSRRQTRTVVDEDSQNHYSGVTRRNSGRAQERVGSYPRRSLGPPPRAYPPQPSSDDLLTYSSPAVTHRS